LIKVDHNFSVDQGALGRVTDEDERAAMAANRMEEDGGESSEDEDEIKGNEASLPNLVSIKKEDGSDVKVKQMVCADSFSAVLSVEGEVYAWGSFRDPSGVIGFSKDMEKKSQKLPIKLTSFGQEKVVLLGSGENHIFAVTSDDTLWAFGANDEYQLGRRVSSRFKNNLEPYEIRGSSKKNSVLHGIVKITGGAYHTLYINNRGELYAFGCNNCGQLGLGDILPHVSGPERVMYAISEDGRTRIELPPIVDIAAGESHSVAVSVDGRVFTFGANLEGQLGYETLRPIFGDERDNEFDIGGTPAKKRVRGEVSSSSEDSSLANTPDKHAPKSGQKASFKLKYQPLPKEVPRTGTVDGEDGLPPLSVDSVVMIDAQSRFTVAVTSLGKLYTWGSGHSYQLGNEEMEDELKPYKVELKSRKCFWVRCGGQYTAFLLEPKQEDSQNNNQIKVATESSDDSNRRNSSHYPPADPNRNPNSSPQQNFQGNGNGSAFAPISPGRMAQYRLHVDVPMTSSVPNTPHLRNRQETLSTIKEQDEACSPFVSERKASLRQSPEKIKQAQADFERTTSPTQMLVEGLDNVLVSPEKRYVGGLVGHAYTKEERIAPWSPNKRSQSTINSHAVVAPKAARKLFPVGNPSASRPRNQIDSALNNNSQDIGMKDNIAGSGRRTRQRTQ
jgi:alpha-tubulin suppressor-like RCC1 family protein